MIFQSCDSRRNLFSGRQLVKASKFHSSPLEMLFYDLDRTGDAYRRSLFDGRSKTTSVTFTHFKAELLVAKQGTLFIQLRNNKRASSKLAGSRSQSSLRSGATCFAFRSQIWRPSNAQLNQRRNRSNSSSGCICGEVPVQEELKSGKRGRRIAVTPDP